MARRQRSGRARVAALALVLGVAVTACSPSRGSADAGFDGSGSGRSVVTEPVMVDDGTVGGATAAPPATAPAILLAVGDVGECRTGGDKGAATAALAATIPGPIALLGDIAYPDATQANYDECFWPSWRPLRDRVRAVIGNHDDRNRAVFFTSWPAAGTTSKPWYSYRVGSWTVLVVEGNCTRISCSAGSPQTTWLKSKLAGTSRCTVLAIHQPRFSSDDEHGDTVAVDPIWRAAYSGGIDLVIAGHAHDYERIGPVGPKGNPNPAGPTLLVVGTGGTALRTFATITPASQVRIDDTFGMARLELRRGSWTSEFLAAPSGEVRDTASGDCR